MSACSPLLVLCLRCNRDLVSGHLITPLQSVVLINPGPAAKVKASDLKPLFFVLMEERVANVVHFDFEIY